MLLLVKLGETLHRHDEFELATGHAFELALQLVRVSAEHLHDLGVLDTVEKLDCLGVVHHAGHRAIESLCTKRGPDTRAQREFGCSALETDEVERQIINLRLALLVVRERVHTVEHGRFFSEDLGVLDEVLPFDRVKLFEVFQ